MKRITNFFKSIIEFFQGIVLELRLVEWWSFGQVVKSTVIVAVLVIMFVLILTGMDQVLVSLRGLLLNRTII